MIFHFIPSLIMSEKLDQDFKLDDWTNSLDDIPVKRSQMNKLIMDYLVLEGFKEAAEKFKVEAGLEIKRIICDQQKDDTSLSDLSSSLDQRIEIREAIEDGKIKNALLKINHHYPELIDQNRNLYFKLQLQQLIELIREQRTEEALNFAQEQLSVDEEFLDLNELERTLALLAFDNPENSPYADLLQMSHRQQLASEVNEAILKDQSGSAEATKPHIVTLIKLLLWTQNELEKKKFKFPKMTDLATATIKELE